MAAGDTERDLARLESELKRLEAEYNMFFAGRLRKPPLETRARVAAIVGQFDRAYIPNYGDRFRFMTLQSRYAAFIDLWDRGMRAREEGRSGPFPQQQRTSDLSPAQRVPEDRILHVAAFKDPVHETDKLQTLYDSLVQARRDVGEQAVPFDKFAELIKDQVEVLKATGTVEVAFKVAVKDGKVSFTARGLKGVSE